MTASRRQWVEGFARADGSDLLAFSRLAHEYTTTQALDVPIATVVGASYGINLLGPGPVPKRPASERVRFLVRGEPGSEVDQQVDQLRAAIRRYGLGRLVLVVEGYGSAQRRWAYAQAVSMPDIAFGATSREYVPVVLEFTRLSDWQDEDATITSLGIGASPATLEVVNAGTANVTDLVIEIASEGVDGYVSPRIDNTTTGEWFQVTRTGSTANHRLRIDTGRARVEESTDGGTTWASVYGDLSIGDTQAGLFTLVPGSNFLEVSQVGTPDMTVTVTFHAPYE